MITIDDEKGGGPVHVLLKYLSIILAIGTFLNY